MSRPEELQLGFSHNYLQYDRLIIAQDVIDVSNYSFFIYRASVSRVFLWGLNGSMTLFFLLHGHLPPVSCAESFFLTLPLIALFICPNMIIELQKEQRKIDTTSEIVS